MNISRGQWLLAITAAATVHLCLLGLFLIGAPSHNTPDEPPRGVMVSLDAFDPGLPPQSAVESVPVETAEPQIATPSAPVPVTASGSVSSGTASVALPQAAADIGPQAADSSTASASGAASTDVTAANDTIVEAIAAPKVTSAVTIRPDDVNEAIAPQEQVTARPADLGDLAPTTQPEQSNGAYGTSEQATNDYIVRLRAWLSRHKQYPVVAREDEIEGTVRLYLVIDASGNLISQHIEQSSGSSILDEAAKKMLARSEPLPRMSASMRRNRLELVVPVVFSLR